MAKDKLVKVPKASTEKAITAKTPKPIKIKVPKMERTVLPIKKPKPIKIKPEVPAAPVQRASPPALVGGYRLPTVNEELDAFKKLVWDINFHRAISMNQGAIVAILERMDSWVNSHSSHNGERGEADIQANVNRAFWTKISKQLPDVK